MLVLGRNLHESIVIGDDIVITIVHVDKGRVRVGIEAPKSVTVHRSELWEELRRSNTAAAGGADAAATSFPGPRTSSGD